MTTRAATWYFTQALLPGLALLLAGVLARLAGAA